MTKNIKSTLILIFGIIISIPTILPLFNEGFFNVHDNTQVERVFEMTNSLSDGHFPVRWVENLGYGYGYPIYNFYAPLPYYLGGFTNLIISNSLLATKIVFGIGLVASFFSMYYLASRLTNKLGGIAAGTLYLYFPYHALGVYVRGAVGEFFAYIFTPLAFLGIYFIYKKSKDKKLPIYFSALTAIPISLVVISHNLSAYMLALFLAPFVLILLFKSKSRKKFIYSIFAVVLFSFLLSAFYILPAALESGFTNVESQVGGGADYRDHFVCVSQLWHSNWGFGGSIPGCIDGLSFSLGKVNVVMAIFAFGYLAYKYIKNRKITQEFTYWILLLFAIFLTLPYSRIIWDTLPFMEFLQFPWRFLNFVSLFLAIIASFFIYKIKNKWISIVVALALVLSTIYTNYQLFSPVEYSNNSNSYYEDVNHIRFEVSKISDEYMPSGFDKPASESAVPTDLFEIENPEATVVLINARTGYYEFFKSGPKARIHINKAYFPSWEAKSNDRMVEIIEENDGMSILLPEGEQSVVMQFKPTSIQMLGNALSVIGLIAVFAVIIVKKKNLYAKT